MVNAAAKVLPERNEYFPAAEGVKTARPATDLHRKGFSARRPPGTGRKSWKCRYWTGSAAT
jgi:hypothetical protein